MILKDIEQLLTIGFNKEFDIINRKERIETYLKINTKAIRGGLIKELGATDFTVLMAIASFMDSNGNCYPTQRQIAKITGMSLTTINTAVSRLLKFKVNDRPLLERELKGDGIKKNSYYSFTNYLEGVEELQIGNTDTDKPKTVLDYLELFCQVYEETYGTAYTPNYGRDVKLIRDKLVSTYTEQDIIYIIETGIRDYASKYSSPKYKYPTVVMITGWLATKIMTDKKENDKILNTVTSMEDNYKDIDFSTFL